VRANLGGEPFAGGVFATASAPSAGTGCSTGALDNCSELLDTFGGLASGGALSGADSKAVVSVSNTGAQSLWNLVDNNGARHRD
jgi:hypothetical protein